MSKRSQEEIIEHNRQLDASVKELIAEADKAQKEGRLDDMRAFDRELDKTREAIRANLMELMAMEDEENKPEKAESRKVGPNIRDDDEGR